MKIIFALWALLYTCCAADLYADLGVRRSDSDRHIKKRFREIARKYHPDKNSSPGAREKFNQAQRAYRTLSDPEKRRKYDQFGHVDGEQNNERQTPFHGFYQFRTPHFPPINSVTETLTVSRWRNFLEARGEVNIIWMYDERYREPSLFSQQWDAASHRLQYLASFTRASAIRDHQIASALVEVVSFKQPMTIFAIVDGTVIYYTYKRFDETSMTDFVKDIYSDLMSAPRIISTATEAQELHYPLIFMTEDLRTSYLSAIVTSRLHACGVPSIYVNADIVGRVFPDCRGLSKVFPSTIVRLDGSCKIQPIGGSIEKLDHDLRKLCNEKPERFPLNRMKVYWWWVLSYAEALPWQSLLLSLLVYVLFMRNPRAAAPPPGSGEHRASSTTGQTAFSLLERDHLQHYDGFLILVKGDAIIPPSVLHQRNVRVVSVIATHDELHGRIAQWMGFSNVAIIVPRTRKSALLPRMRAAESWLEGALDGFAEWSAMPEV